ncbi:MAG TPA: response regulator [Casimicrobiaceae bacterium]|jgi:CheY-like chemotaxis protein
MKQILLVDDNPLNVNLARTILTRAGHTVRTANSAPQALALLHESMPDVVVTDINMPGVTGTEMCRDLRTRFPASALRIVAYTALAMSGELRAIESAGFDAIVVKPATKDALLKAVDASLPMA